MSDITECCERIKCAKEESNIWTFISFAILLNWFLLSILIMAKRCRRRMRLMRGRMGMRRRRPSDVRAINIFLWDKEKAGFVIDNGRVTKIGNETQEDIAGEAAGADGQGNFCTCGVNETENEAQDDLAEEAAATNGQGYAEESGAASGQDNLCTRGVIKTENVTQEDIAEETAATSEQDIAEEGGAAGDGQDNLCKRDVIKTENVAQEDLTGAAAAADEPLTDN